MQTAGGFPFQLTGAAREAALARCRAVVRGWGLALPEVEPLVLDFGLGRFAEVGEIEFWLANEPDHGYCGKLLFVDDGQTCPYHHHRRKHETFFVVKGAVRMVVDGEMRTLGEGEILVMAPGQRHAFSGSGPALLLEVSMPSVRHDSFFADARIGESGVL